MRYIDSEEKAMRWLTTILPRDPNIKNDNQVIIRITPAALPQGGCLVIVSVKHPDIGKRVRGFGKTLAGAVQHVVTVLEAKHGIVTEFDDRREIE
jgi:hypothetical protein